MNEIPLPKRAFTNLKFFQLPSLFKRGQTVRCSRPLPHSSAFFLSVLLLPRDSLPPQSIDRKDHQPVPSRSSNGCWRWRLIHHTFLFFIVSLSQYFLLLWFFFYGPNFPVLFHSTMKIIRLFSCTQSTRFSTQKQDHLQFLMPGEIGRFCP